MNAAAAALLSVLSLAAQGEEELFFGPTDAPASDDDAPASDDDAPASDDDAPASDGDAPASDPAVTDAPPVDAPDDEPALLPGPAIEGLRPEAVLSYTGEELMRRGYRTLGEALRDVVGVVRVNTTRGARYSMRGVPQGLALVIDGVPQVVEGQRDRLDVEDALDLADVERVEIVRGPTSALDGASPLGGVVRVFTRRPGVTGAAFRAGGYHAGDEPLDGVWVGGEGSARFGDASFLVIGRYRQGPRQSWIIKNAPRRFLVVGSAAVPGTRDDATVTPDDESALNARALASIWGFSLDLAYAHTEQRTPLSALSHAILHDPDTRARDRARARANWRGDLWIARVDATVQARWQSIAERYALYPPSQAFPAGGEIAVRTGGVSAQAVVRADVPITLDHRLRFGLFTDVARTEAQSDVTRPDDGVKQSRFITLAEDSATASGAVEYQGDLGFGLHVTGGGVLRWRTGYPVVVLPRAALGWAALPQLSFRVAYAEGTRAPDRFDLVSLTPAVFGGRVETVDPATDLLAEHSRSLEVGAQYRPSAALRVDADAYGTRHENAVTTEVDDGVVMPTNRAARHLVGVEGRAEVDPVPGLVSLYVAGWWSYTLDGPALGQDVGSGTAGVELSPLAGLDVGTRAFVQGRHVVTGLADGTTGSWDLYATFGPPDVPVRLNAAVTNVTDAWQPAPDPAGLPNAADVWSPAPGRRVSFWLEGRL